MALTLRLLGGLTVAEIAQAFLVPETTMAQRITRAKKKISVAKILPLLILLTALAIVTYVPALSLLLVGRAGGAGP